MNWENFIGKTGDSTKVLLSNWKIIWIAVLAEILFLRGIAYLKAFFVPPIQINLDKLGGVMINEGKNIGKGFLGEIVRSESFRNMLLLSLGLAIAMYLLYCFFQGFIWRFCFNLTEKKRYSDYIKRFFLVNILWFALYVIYFLIDFILSYMDFVNNRMNPAGGMGIAGYSVILLAAIAYFGFISYVMIEKHKPWKSIKESFRIGWKRFIWIASSYITIWAVFTIIGYPLTLADNFSITLMIVLGVILVLPTVLWARIFLKEVIDAV